MHATQEIGVDAPWWDLTRGTQPRLGDDDLAALPFETVLSEPATAEVPHGPDPVITRFDRRIRNAASSATDSETSPLLMRSGRKIVLFKNDGGLLPLRGVKDVTLIGKLADTPNIGDHGSSSTQPPYITTMLQGLKAAYGVPLRIQYEEGSDPARAAAAARFCDVAVVVVGYTYRDEGEYLDPGGDGPWTDHFPKTPDPEDVKVAKRLAEMSAALGSHMQGIGGDRTSLTLHPEDEAPIKAVAAANPRTVVAIMSGSAVIMESWRDDVAAILLLGYPGQEGGHAFADVLLGHVNPSGKLPYVIPRSPDHLPFFDKDATEITYDLWHGYRKLERDGVAPAFPFGFGLSYTTFQLSDLQLAQQSIAADGALRNATPLQAALPLTRLGPAEEHGRHGRADAAGHGRYRPGA